MRTVTLGTLTPQQADEFVTQEWPRHDEPLGIRWNSRDFLVAARQEEELVGVARGVLVGGLGELKQLLVKLEWARKGVGSRLLTAFEQHCVQAGCHKLRLDTADYQARPFYERHGFVVAATLTNDRFGHDWYVMEKRLGNGR